MTEPLVAESILDRVADWAGLVLPRDRREGLVATIQRRISICAGTTPGPDPDALPSDQALLDAVIDDLTVGESYFFRDPAQFDFIREAVLPTLIRPQAQAPLRIWSAGCATGEEAYSLAILLREAGLAGRSHVIGTDIVRSRLTRARKARYSRWSLRGTSDHVVQAYFRRQGSHFELRPAIRSAVVYRHLNLAEARFAYPASQLASMDLILCRNVLIYFSPRTVARVASALLDCLSDAGWLLLGGADPPLGSLVECETVLTSAGVAYRRKRTPSRRSRGLAAPVVPSTPPPAVPSPDPLPRSAPTQWRGKTAQPDDRTPEARSMGAAPPIAVVLQQVRTLADAGQLKEAGLVCAAALDRSPVCAELHYLHSLLLHEAGLHREAATAASRALYLDRNLVPGHLALGCALVRLGDTERARRAFRNAERILAAMMPSHEVPGAGGESAGRLAAFARMQLQLIGDAA